jgi:cation transport ATPase
MRSRCWQIRHTEFVAVIIKFREKDAHPTGQCIMITGDNPLTALHVARDVEIVDREALILDLKENPAHEKGK